MMLADVIARVESENNPKAWRFEADLYHTWTITMGAHFSQRLAIALHNNGCSHNTATAIACSSWGAWQIMGFNLYDPDGINWQRTIFEYLDDPVAQRASFDTFCQRRKIAFTVEELVNDEQKRLAFVRAYNGPGNVNAYWDAMRRVIDEAPST